MAGRDTIVALSSGRLPAAIGIVRASGPGALELAGALAGALPEARHAVLRRFVDPVSGEEIDRGLLLLFPGPDSATGEDLVEFHLHGSRAVVDRLLGAALAMASVRLADPGEFTRRALTNGRIDLIEAEGLAELLAAETELQRRAAQSRAGGGVSRLLEEWRQRLLSLAAAAEIAIDYADEEDGADAPSIVAPALALAKDIERRLDAPRIDRLRDGFRVVLAGPPNAGKSSLLNALAQSDRAIVAPIAGTTRDSIEVPVSRDGVPLVLIDTAGLRRDGGDVVERLGIARAQQEIGDADLILWLGPGEPPADRPVLALSPKSDIVTPVGGRLAVSARTGEGLEAVWAAINDQLARRIPAISDLALSHREAGLLEEIATFLRAAADVVDPLVASEELRAARFGLDRLTGRAGVEDLLDTLFGRFCVGK